MGFGNSARRLAGQPCLKRFFGGQIHGQSFLSAAALSFALILPGGLANAGHLRCAVAFGEISIRPHVGRLTLSTDKVKPWQPSLTSTDRELVYFLGGGLMGGPVYRVIARDGRTPPRIYKIYRDKDYFLNDMRALELIRRNVGQLRLPSGDYGISDLAASPNTLTQEIAGGFLAASRDYQGETVAALYRRLDRSGKKILKKTYDEFLFAFKHFSPLFVDEDGGAVVVEDIQEIDQAGGLSSVALRIVTSTGTLNYYVKPDNMLVLTDGQLVLIDPL